MVSPPGVGRNQLASQRLELPAGTTAGSGKECSPACGPAATVPSQKGPGKPAKAGPLAGANGSPTAASAPSQRLIEGRLDDSTRSKTPQRAGWKGAWSLQHIYS